MRLVPDVLVLRVLVLREFVFREPPALVVVDVMVSNIMVNIVYLRAFYLRAVDLLRSKGSASFATPDPPTLWIGLGYGLAGGSAAATNRGRRRRWCSRRCSRQVPPRWRFRYRCVESSHQRGDRAWRIRVCHARLVHYRVGRRQDHCSVGGRSASCWSCCRRRRLAIAAAAAGTGTTDVILRLLPARAAPLQPARRVHELLG